MEAKKLQKRTILKMLKQCRENNRVNSVYMSYLCIKLKDLIAKHLKINYNDVNDDVSIYIPLFNHSNAVKHANADPCDDNGEVPYVWWNAFGCNTIYDCNMKRVKFLDWLIEQYS